MKNKDIECEDDDFDVDNMILANKYNNDLFDDEKYIPYKLVTVKRVVSSGGIEDWKVLDNNKVVFTLKGSKLTNNEKTIMRKPEGLKLLIEEYKKGNLLLKTFKDKLTELGKKI